MLTMILGTDWKSNRMEILKMVASDVKACKANRILMVPESISHQTERVLCETAGNSASLFAEVLSFPRLANRVAEQLGVGIIPCMDNGGRVVAMASAAIQLHSQLKAYAALETRPEFLTGLVEAVDEFKRCCINARDLMEASKRTVGSLAQKLEELSLILNAYDAVCSQGLRDPRDVMSWLLEQLEDSCFVEPYTLFVDGFPDFTRQHMAILQHFILHAENVTISLNCDEVGSKRTGFETAGSTAAQLLQFATDNCVEVRIKQCDPIESELHQVPLKLFSGSVAYNPGLRERLFVMQCDGVINECNIIAEKVMDYVRNGARFRDFNIVCTDANVYSGPLRLAFARRGIPLYISGTEDILDMPVVNTTLTALDAALCGFEQQDMFRYLKSALSPIDDSICDELENYVVQWNIRGSQWNETWKYHPDGLAKVFDFATEERLARLNEARAQIVAPLNVLRDGFKTAANLREQTVTLYHFLVQIEMAQRLEILEAQMHQSGDSRSAQLLGQLWEILIGALEQLHDVLGHSIWTPDNFTRLLRLLLSQYDVGSIPPVLDAVTVGPVNAMCGLQSKHVFLLGAQEGLLPAYSGAAGVLNDQERMELRKLGVSLTGGAMDGLHAEFAQIYSVFCGAENTITITSPSAQKSFIFTRLERMANEKETPKAETDSMDVAFSSKMECSSLLFRHGLEDIAERLGLKDYYRSVKMKAEHCFGSVSPENIAGLYGKTLHLSASQIDKQAECRLAYFLKYGLHAKERKTFTVDPAEFGTYVHDVLEKTGREIKNLGGFRQVSLHDTLDIAYKYAQAYMAAHFSQLESDRMNYLFQRNRQELEMVVTELWEELQQSLFQPEDFEVAFGIGGNTRVNNPQGSSFAAISVPGKKMHAQLGGFVDRVDTWKSGEGNYYRVVDYKTGKKKLDYCDLINGIGLQMLLYLFALEDCGTTLIGNKPIPAGVQYFPARAPVVSVDGKLSDVEARSERMKEWKRNGLLLNDDKVICAMDDTDDIARLCCKRKKDGSLSGDLANRDQLRELKKYVFSFLGRMVDEIADGCVDPNPYTRGSSFDSCMFCPYAAICHPDNVEGRRNYAKISASDFWEQVGKGVHANG